MTLVEKAFLDHLKEKKVQTALSKPQLQAMVRLQQQIDTILDSTVIPDDIRKELLDYTQNRFDKLRQNFGSIRSDDTVLSLAQPTAEMTRRQEPQQQQQQQQEHNRQEQHEGVSAQEAREIGYTTEYRSLPRKRAKYYPRDSGFPTSVQDEELEERANQRISSSSTGNMSQTDSSGKSAPISAGAETTKAASDVTHSPPHPKHAKEIENASSSSQETNLRSVHIPIQYFNKFQKLERFLSQTKSTISVNEQGELVIAGRRIPNSNFADLMRSLYVPNKHYNLTGIAELRDALIQHQVPAELFSNSSFLMSYPMLGGVSARTQSVPPMASASASYPQLTAPSVTYTNPYPYATHQKGHGTHRSACYKPPGSYPRILRIYRL